MSSKDDWSADGQILPHINPHTQAKHRIIEKYIENLIVTLYGTGQRGVDTFTIVDGFCGGGMYYEPNEKIEWEGSPIRLINAVRRGFEISRRTYDLNIKFVFIDHRKNHLSCLKQYSMPWANLAYLADENIHSNQSDWGGTLIEQCQFICGNFEKVIHQYISEIEKERKGHSFFLLDPYGWNHISMKTIRRINALKRSEILYNYMVDRLKINVFGKDNKYRDSFNKILEANGYYEKIDLYKMDRFGEQAYFRNESMRLFRDRGDSKYVFTFSLIPRGLVRALYYLIHISSNIRALEVMKDVFWQENNLDYQYHFEIYGYGYRTAEFYQEGQMDIQFDITQDNQESSINSLNDYVTKIIGTHTDGILFRDICQSSMELTPASLKQYEEFLKRLRDAGEIEILRKGELYKGNREIRKSDIIKLPRTYQISLFSQSPFS